MCLPNGNGALARTLADFLEWACRWKALAGQ